MASCTEVVTQKTSEFYKQVHLDSTTRDLQVAVKDLKDNRRGSAAYSVGSGQTAHLVRVSQEKIGDKKVKVTVPDAATPSFECTPDQNYPISDAARDAVRARKSEVLTSLANGEG